MTTVEAHHHRRPAAGLLSLDDVVTRLCELEGTLEEGDGVACFNALYLEVIEVVRDRLACGTCRDAAFVEALTAMLADRYLAAADRSSRGLAKVAKAWAPLFEARLRIGVSSIQYALGGLNAALNHDLPLAIVTTCELAGRGLADPAVREDVERLGAVVADVEEQARLSFFEAEVVQGGTTLSQVVGLISAFDVRRATETAWSAAEVLWTLRDQATLQESYALTLARLVGLAGRGLVVPAQGRRG